ncbi:MAG TPA: hypothetical protein VLJ58_21265 [Ramlibacter sp.]|nr:hypothetical protein [Ramlibacter sp.]
MNPVAIDTDQFLAANVTGLSETDILDCFNAADALQGQRNYLVAVGRAIEAKVLESQEFYPALDSLSRAQLRKVIGRMNFTLTHYKQLTASLRKRVAGTAA